MHKETYDKPKPTNTFSPNRYQLLEPTSENIELVSENIHRNRKFTEFKKKKQNLNFSRCALFRLKIRVSLKYFVNDCRSRR